MCLIVVKPKGEKLPLERYLKNGADKNADGIGVSYWKVGEDEVHIKKNFKNIESFLNWMNQTIKEEDALVIHFRLATHGLKDKGNRHPFPITYNKKLLRETELTCQMAVSHNGILTQYDSDQTYSDTQKFVVDILADEAIKNNLDSPAVQKLIDEFLNRDRLAILKKDGLIQLFGEFEEEDKLYYSNTGYKWGKYTASYGLGELWTPDKGWVREPENTPTKITHITKEGCAVYFALCDGCTLRKSVMFVEHKGEYYQLCKKCRKNLKKGYINLITNNDPDEKTEEPCDNCGESFPKEQIVQNVEWRLCPDCDKVFDLNGKK